ncbi:MAG: ribosome-binding factor A [Planctomycetes bacterium]|nr:ribosome-binding factor A [Planctomycetota bacterium]MBI3843331.1 ribosome-binding factor A [Planctomycetota bacterium]
MSPKKRPRSREFSRFDDFQGFGDDADLDSRFDDSFDRKPDRKVLRLCGQVARSLGIALAGSCADEILRDLVVVSVVPAPDATRLAVTLRFGGPDAVVDLDDVLERLAGAAGFLRSEIASAIERRKVPQLAFRIEPSQEGQP